MDFLTGLAQLRPALGSVVVIGVICWKLLEMFANNNDVLKSFLQSLAAHTDAIHLIGKNVEANTKATEKMVDIIERDSINRRTNT